MASDKSDFLEELKRRHVWRVAVAYAVAGWLIVQIATQVFPFFNIPNWGVRLVVILIAIGFPVAVAFAWIYELTPEGIRRTAPVDSPDARPAPVNRQLGRKLNAIIVATLVLAVALLGWRLFAVRHDEATNPAKTAAFARATPAASTDGKVSAATTRGASATSLVTSPVTAQPIPAKSVAVLPFENLSTDKGNAYFADGMQDLILTKLADIGDLKVISRTSTLQYGSHPENLTLIGKQLGVATILEGSVQKAGKQVLINVQLIDASTDAHIWAQSYQRTLDNIFGVEGEVADKVAKALNAKLTNTEQREVARLPTTNPEAYTLYLKAVHEINQFFTGDNKADDVKLAVSYLQHAVDKDPKFALAYALLARAQGDLQFNDIENSPALARSELANARKAVVLQPNLAEAHDYLAVAYGANGMPDKVIPELETALRLDPTNLQTRFHLAVFLRHQGDWEKAQAVMAPVLRMNPTNPLAYMRVAETDMILRRYDSAQTVLTQGLAIAPESQGLIADQVSLFLLRGEPSMALQWSAKVTATGGVREQFDYYAYMQLRQFAQALSVAQTIPENKDGLVSASMKLMVAAAAQHTGDQTLASEALTKARNAIKPYLRNPDAGAVMALSHRIQAYGMLAEIEKLSGHREAAMDAARKARSLSPSPSAFAQTQFLERTAIIAAYFTDAKEAVDALQKVLSTQGTGEDISDSMLRLDPTWDPIRHDPAFQALLKKYGGAQATPAAASTSVASVPHSH